ncbi:hypothetical protein O6P43_003169 [Quillaja saponaria]|uniref:Uncharacterized protein n=1 Tax=Quillaja saponaria TaxID=32244 RepID=A0AAD7QE24_QUISA|nr:hypothetical protein O6P43_003169 [Quillaja saponaria]
MGCFLGCFGFSNKRKRRKPVYKVLAAARDQRHGTYEALNSSVTINLDIKDIPIVPHSDSGDEHKKQTRTKSRKKVRFNLNVQTYEPISTDYQILENNEDEDERKETGETENESLASSCSKAEVRTYPSNFRYQNIRDSYDEEDELAFEEYDLDLDNDEYYDDGDDDDGDCSDSGVGENDSDYEVYGPKASEGEILEQKSPGSKLSDLRIQYVHSVLRPVENLTQWKAIKARVAASKHKRKEDVPLEQRICMPLNPQPTSFQAPFRLKSSVIQSKPLVPEIAVDTSLSNWLLWPSSSRSQIEAHC